ncbi:MAG: beta-ketoacyl-[acyl-carrier-protein] synthase family protein [Candidatus Omnitrophica bacterium]|nr:beta-ketoacyl-[acyl-carrier-protein] synthase family protein [Candidatus Omnitrophota bacterium]
MIWLSLLRYYVKNEEYLNNFMAERVVITGLGAVSSLGQTVEDFWSNLIQGKSGVSEITSFDTSRLERHYGGEIKNFVMPDSNGLRNINKFTRTQQFAISSSSQALKDAGIKKSKDAGLIIGTIVSGVEYVEKKDKKSTNYPAYKCAAAVFEALRLGKSAFTISGACAAGNYAIALAYERIKNGYEDYIIATGVDYFALGTFIGFYKLFSLAPLKCQPFDRNRKGVIPAEGSGALVVESLSSAKKRGARIYAEILGYGMNTDSSHALIPSEEGIFNCMKQTVAYAGAETKDIDYISAHGTGTIPNDRAECRAIKKLFGVKRYRKVAVSSIKSMLGHAMGAASSFESIACCLSLATGIIPPTINYETPDPECDVDCVPNCSRRQKPKIIMNNSFGFGGMNCSVVFASYK